MAIGGNMYRADKTETKKKWRHFTLERCKLLREDYDRRLHTEGKRKSVREIQEDMAEDWNCDVRTVQRHLQEEPVHRMQNPLVSKREICNIIQDWEFDIRAPRIEEITLSTTVPDHFVQAHTLFKDIWQKVFPKSLHQEYGTWREETAKYLGICKTLIAEVEKEGKRWQGVSVQRSFHRPIFKRLAQKADGKEPKAHDINIVSLVTKENTEVMEVDSWSVIEGQYLSPYRKQYRLLSDHIMNDVMSYTAIDVLKRVRDLEEKIHESLHEIICQYSEYEAHTLMV